MEGSQNESPEGLPNEAAFGLVCAVVDIAIADRAAAGGHAPTGSVPGLNATPALSV